METHKIHMIKDHKLRPWTLNEHFDAHIKEACYELDTAARRTVPYKNSGDYGLSSLDRTPAELVELEKLLLNIDSYPVIETLLPSEVQRRNKKQTAEEDRPYTVNNENRLETPSASGKYTDMSNEPETEVEVGIIEISSAEREPISRHSVKRFMSASVKPIKPSIYGSSRRKAAMKSVAYQPRRGPTVVDTSTENFHRFLQKHAKRNAYIRYLDQIQLENRNQIEENMEDNNEYYNYNNDNDNNIDDNDEDNNNENIDQNNDLLYNESIAGNSLLPKEKEITGTGFASKLRQTTARPASAPTRPSSSNSTRNDLHNTLQKNMKTNVSILKTIPQENGFLGVDSDNDDIRFSIIDDVSAEVESSNNNNTYSNNKSNNGNNNNNNNVRNVTQNGSYNNRNNENSNSTKNISVSEKTNNLNKDPKFEKIIKEIIIAQNVKHSSEKDTGNSTVRGSEKAGERGSKKGGKGGEKGNWATGVIEGKDPIAPINKIRPSTANPRLSISRQGALQLNNNHGNNVYNGLFDNDTDNKSSKNTINKNNKNSNNNHNNNYNYNGNSNRNKTPKTPILTQFQTLNQKLKHHHEKQNNLKLNLSNPPENFQPFWEQTLKKIEKDKANRVENERKEEKEGIEGSREGDDDKGMGDNDKGLFWKASEDPLVDRVKTPTEDLRDIFTAGSVQNGHPVLSKRRIKEVRTSREKMMTTAGLLSAYAHVDPDHMKSARRDNAEIAAITRGMVADVVLKNKEDSIWGVLTTPGFMELMGPANVYRSESNLAHTSSDRLTKALHEVDLSLGMKMDRLRIWTDAAAANKVKLFPSGGGFKFN